MSGIANVIEKMTSGPGNVDAKNEVVQGLAQAAIGMEQQKALMEQNQVRAQIQRATQRENELKDPNLNRLMMDYTTLDAQEKGKIEAARSAYIVGIANNKKLEMELAEQALRENARKEKNSYRDGATRRVFRMKPINSNQIIDRLRDHDMSWIRGPEDGEYKRVKDATVKLSNLKDNLYADRVREMHDTIKGIDVYDKFTRLQQEERDKAARTNEMKGYIDDELYASKYKNKNIFIPQIFGLNTSEMGSLFNYRDKMFRKNTAYFSAGLTVQIFSGIHGFFTFLSLYFLARAEEREKEERGFLTAIALMAMGSVAIQYFLRSKADKKRSINKASPWIGLSVSLAFSGVLAWKIRTAKKLNSEKAYFNAKNLAMGANFCLLLNLFIMGRTVAAQRPSKGMRNKDALPMYNLGILAGSIALVSLFILPNAFESNRKCKKMETGVCLRQLSPENTKDLIRRRAWEGPGHLGECTETLPNDFLINSLNQIVDVD